MKKTLIFALLLLVAATATATDRSPSKKKNAKAQPTAVAPAPTPTPEEKKAEPEVTPKTEAEKEAETEADIEELDDFELGMSAAQADSLVAVWHERQREETYSDFFKNYILSEDTYNDMTPDSVYSQRLKNLVSPIQLAYNPVVKQKIGVYTKSRYGLMSRILGMSRYYFPLIEEELIKADLPVELRALPIIESALIPTATSRMGACGLWQFMPGTGKIYGLEVNSLVDERRDPVRSTQAACRYLKDLYNIYNDWTLVIAAYNCGPGNVNKAIARSGGKNFWQIYDYLPHETRGYLPAFIGATYAYAYHQLHGIKLTDSPIPLAVDTIQVNRLLHFGQISSTIGVPIETLRQLNPQYKLDIIPATTRSYTLTLPTRMVSQYIAHEPEIYAKDSTYLKDYLNPINLDRKRQESSSYSSSSKSSYYTVRKGDTLGAIAHRYHTTTSMLMRLNGIRNAHALRLGQHLRLHK